MTDGISAVADISAASATTIVANEARCDSLNFHNEIYEDDYDDDGEHNDYAADKYDFSKCVHHYMEQQFPHETYLLWSTNA